MSTTTRKNKPVPEKVIVARQKARQARYEQDAREALARMQMRELDERFDFSYDPYTSTLRYRIRIDQGNDTDWQQAYTAAQRVAAKHGAQVSNVRWGKDFWMVELNQIVAHPQIG